MDMMKPTLIWKALFRGQFKLIAVAIAIVGLCGMGGCARSQDALTVAGSDSPQGAVDAYTEAVLARDYSSILAQVKPSLKLEYRKVLAAHGRYVDAGREAMTRLTGKQGKDAAERFNLIVFLPHERMLTGVLLWDGPSRSGVVKPGSDGDVPSAYPIMAENVDTGLVVQRVRGKWYVGPGPDRDLSAHIRAYETMLDAATDDFNRLSTEELLGVRGTQ